MYFVFGKQNKIPVDLRLGKTSNSQGIFLMHLSRVVRVVVAHYKYPKSDYCTPYGIFSVLREIKYINKTKDKVLII